MTRWMIYGANGFTGRALAKLAEQHGERPVLAGRSAAKILPLADELGLDHVVVDLADTSGLHAALADIDLVANCAGPFSQTAAPLVFDTNQEVQTFGDIRDRNQVNLYQLHVDAGVKVSAAVMARTLDGSSPWLSWWGRDATPALSTRAP